jgi:hypothetical protein
MTINDLEIRYTRVVGEDVNITWLEFLAETKKQLTLAAKETHRQMSIYSIELDKCKNAYDRLYKAIKDIENYEDTFKC